VGLDRPKASRSGSARPNAFHGFSAEVIEALTVRRLVPLGRDVCHDRVKKWVYGAKVISWPID